MIILAIESSCDETSTAVVKDSKVLSNIISSQYFHSKFGGVVPELASRAHLKTISRLTKEALLEAEIDITEVDALAVTSEPGLAGSLLVGSNFTKGLALRYNLPIIPINHIEGHIYSGMLGNLDIEFPYVSLVVSGGHTIIFNVHSYEQYDILGSTIDDAAGEAFDKTATLLGLPYPGGPLIDKLSACGNPNAVSFPRSMINNSDYNFSFSGLKTAVKYYIAKNYPEQIPENIIPDLAASIQGAITDVLVKKTMDAAFEYQSPTIMIAGGVSANSALRKKLISATQKAGIRFIAPEMSLCMDNAAMIAFIAEQKALNLGLERFRDLTFTVKANTVKQSIKLANRVNTNRK